MRKVLIITYYWPPAGGGGVQRWLKTAKYLPEFGYEPIVLAPSNPAYPLLDESFLEEAEKIRTIRAKIWEPSRFLSKMGAKETAKLSEGFVQKKPSWFKSMAVAIRGNFFIPDARKFWIKPAVKRIENLLKEEKVDVIVSTGPPHTAHLIAMQIKEKHNIPWLADFRDPWTNIDFYKDLKLSAWADGKHKKLEREVLQKANQVVTIGKTLSHELNALGASNCEVVTNGFDKEIPMVYQKEKFSFLHIGRLGEARSPLAFWESIAALKKENPSLYADLKVRLIGNVDGAISDTINALGIRSCVEFSPRVSNDEALQLQAKSFALLLLINDAPNAKGILTGKFFEYLSTGRPVLGIGPVDGDAAQLMKECDAGPMLSFSDKEGIKEALVKMYNEYCKDDKPSFNPARRKYSRQAQSEKMATILDKL